METSIQPSGGDDTATIQEAINDTSATGGNVWLEAGAWNISKLQMKNWTSLKGRGRGVTKISAIQSNVNMIEILDVYGITLADFSMGNQNIVGVQPENGIFVAAGSGNYTNLITMERIFVSGAFNYGALWVQCCTSVEAWASQFWNYWEAYGIGICGNPALPSSFGSPLSQSIPVSALSFSACEVHAMAIGGQGGVGIQNINGINGPNYGLSWAGGIVSAPTYWSIGIGSPGAAGTAYCANPAFTCEVPGGNPRFG